MVVVFISDGVFCVQPLKKSNRTTPAKPFQALLLNAVHLND